MAASVTNVDWVPANDLGSSLGERALPLAAMGGAVSGAIGGAVWAGGADVLALLCGTLGTMFGSIFAAWVGLAVVRLWARPAGESAEMGNSVDADAVASR
jgi:hypothetical protein